MLKRRGPMASRFPPWARPSRRSPALPAFVFGRNPCDVQFARQDPPSAGPASAAESLFSALAKANNYNSELNSARAGVRVTDESVAIAKSGMRPVIAGFSTLDYTEQNGTRLTTGKFGVQIEQKLFDGFQTRNSVRAAEAKVRSAGESLRNTEQNILFNGASAFMDVIRDRAVAALHEVTHLPVVVDPSHATGHSKYVPPMSLAAAAAGANGLIIEVHNDPAHALCDGPQSITPAAFAELTGKIRPILDVVGKKIV